MKNVGLTPLKIRGTIKAILWSKTSKRSKREGTYEECYRKGQIRILGKKSK